MDILSSPTRTVVAASVQTDHRKKFQDLEELKARLEEFVQVKPRAVECFNDTRTDILSAIEGKAKSAEDKNIIHIRGAPGSGKSSISLTTKSRLHRQGRLITYFRFDRNQADITTSSAFWSRVAYDLADRYPSVLNHSLSLLQANKINLTSTMDLFTTLVEGPLSNLTDLQVECPLVIIVDALDECGGFEGRSSLDRRALLKTLERWARVPKHFKIIATSREEGDIDRVLSPICAPINIPSGNFLTDNPHDPASISASRDISVFLEDRFREIREPLSSLPPDWPGKKMIAKMVKRAAGNFMWVTTAASFIESGHPQDQLHSIMNPTPGSTSMKPLYSLYSTIIEVSFGSFVDNSSATEALRAVLGTIIFAQRPFRDDDYAKLPTTKRVDKTMVELIRDRLRSVIDQGPSLRFVHKSFDDFLLSEECPSKYRIQMDESQYLLTKLCLTTMTKNLHFNMCGLETSCSKNADVPDIATKVAEGFTALLSYSCHFWTIHLTRSPFDEQLMAEAKVMILDKLLYWFEAMSLLKGINQASHSLFSLLKWSHPSPDDEFKEFLRDARRFIGAFGHAIAESAPHIYISALPFAPKYSSVAKHFLPRFPWILSLDTGKPLDWPPCVFVSGHHKDTVTSVALSPDEKYFVSGSEDGTTSVFDSETGNLAFGPFRTGFAVVHVFFDLGGQRVWTLDGLAGRVVSWDVETGDEHLDFRAGWSIGCRRFDGDEDIVSISGINPTVILWSADTGKQLQHMPIDGGVTRVTLSPNGIYIACAGYIDVAPRIWQLVDRNEIQLVQGPSDVSPQFKHAEPITALSFSEDSNLAASGSSDGSILIWNAGTGGAVGPPLHTGRGEVHAVAYSVKSGLIVSACGFAVTTWNASTYEAVLGPLEGHTDLITSIALSRDGRWALTASFDGTVRKWDLGRKGAVSDIQFGEGHKEVVQCFASSPCSERLASLSGDKTIRFWDVNSGEPLLRPILLPHNNYFQIVFSADERQILAYNLLHDIGVWDVETGNLAFHKNLIGVGELNTYISHVAFRSTDQQLVICSDDGFVRIWNLEDSALEVEVVAVLPRILALSPDGLTAVVCDNNGNTNLYMWSTTTYQIVRPLPLPFCHSEHVSGVLRACYSPSGQFFAVASRFSLRVWNTHTGRLAAGASPLDGEVRSLVFSPDNFHIAFTYYTFDGQSGTTIWIWNMHTGRLASGSWNVHDSNITALTFSPDGKKLVSGSRDGQIRIWNTDNLLRNPPVVAGSMGNGVHMRDGWVMNLAGNLFFWVPMDHRDKLTWNGNVAVIGGMGINTQVDLTRFRYAEKWVECRRGGI